MAGTTSACAENTLSGAGMYRWIRNYLRVRGEYWMRRMKYIYGWELPPRARRILMDFFMYARELGTTSACAENTPCYWANPLARWNYLRVRGEYKKPPAPRSRSTELPPRARRIRQRFMGQSPKPGTTSACAENTEIRHWAYRHRGNYLRVRGEYLRRVGA